MSTLVRMRPTRVRARAGVETRRTTRVVGRIVGCLAAVAAATAILVAVGADLAFAASALLFVVVAVSLLGYGPGIASAVFAAVLLNYYFTPPRHSLSIEKTDDVLALAAFVAVSLIVATLVARLNELRRRSELGAREAHLRLEATNQLVGGRAAAAVLQEVAEELVLLFDLASCDIAAGGIVAHATGARGAIDTLVMRQPALTLRLGVDRPLRADEQHTLEALATGLDTALDRTRLQDEAREQELRADIDRSRIAFLRAVTHDVRTPIATIKTATGALLAPTAPLDDEERRELLEAAYDESERLEGLVTKVLDLTRIRSGAVVPEREVCAAADLVRAAVDRLGTTAEAHTITLDIDPSLPGLHVDPLLVEHVLANVLENAIVHNPSTSAILVRASARGHRVELAVVDHGPGIASGDRERVFDEFVRLQTGDARGSGLGLTIVHALTEANGGAVRLEETPGGGTTVVLDLPSELCEGSTT
jgi:two-component system sensor histidine kinase KdpD